MMKKIGSAFLYAALFLLFSAGLLTNAHAASGMEKAVSGTVTKLAYSQSGDSEEIRIYTSDKKILRQFVLAPNNDCRNYRIGIEIEEAVIHRNGAFDINQGTVYQIRYANKTNPQAASVVIETTKKPDYTITPSSDGKYLSVKLKGSLSGQPSPGTVPSPAPSPAPSQPSVPGSGGTGNSQSQGTASIGPISLSTQGNTDIIKLEGINLNSAYGLTGRMPTVELRQKERILQVTLPGMDSRIDGAFIAGRGVIYGVLANYNSKQDSTIIRIAYTGEITYTQEVSGGSTVFVFKRAGSGSSGSAGNPGGTPTPSPSPAPTPSPSPSPSPGNDPSRGGSNRSTVNASFSSSSVSITAPSTQGYRAYTAQNPSRIVIEIPGTVTPGEKGMPSGYLYQKAVLSQMNASMARIELYTSELTQWNLDAGSTSLKVSLSQNGTSNIQPGDGEDVALKLIGANIVGKYRQYADKILSENNTKQNTFAFMFPIELIDLGKGDININNAVISKVTTLTTPSSSFLQMYKKDASKGFSIIEGSSANELLIVARDVSEDSSGIPSTGPITNPTSSAKSKLIVLDAGHGGSDPGAEFSGYLEKTLNLDITLRTEAILKQKGINVKLTRSTDVFVGLEQRLI